MRLWTRAAGLTLVATLFCFLAPACSAPPTSVQDPAVDPTQSPLDEPRPTSNIAVSDAVPTLDELQDLGLSKMAAECFIATIDPDDTGRVASAELFMQAWVACL